MVPSKTLDRLHYVRNPAARVLTHTKPWQDITPTLIHLLWLPVKPSRDYKIILLLTYKSLHALASQHLSDLLLPCSAPRNHQFLDTGPLSISHTRLRTFGVTSPPHLWTSSKNSSNTICSLQLTTSLNSTSLPDTHLCTSV